MVRSTNFSHAGGFSTQHQARFKVAPSLCILNVFINVCSHALLSYQLTDLFFFNESHTLFRSQHLARTLQ